MQYNTPLLFSKVIVVEDICGITHNVAVNDFRMMNLTAANFAINVSTWAEFWSSFSLSFELETPAIRYTWSSFNVSYVARKKKNVFADHKGVKSSCISIKRNINPLQTWNFSVKNLLSFSQQLHNCEAKWATTDKRHLGDLENTVNHHPHIWARVGF